MEAGHVLSVLSFPPVQAQTWSDNTELLPQSEVPPFSGFLHVVQICKELASIVFIIFECSTLPRARSSFVQSLELSLHQKLNLYIFST